MAEHEPDEKSPEPVHVEPIVPNRLTGFPNVDETPLSLSDGGLGQLHLERAQVVLPKSPPKDERLLMDPSVYSQK